MTTTLTFRTLFLPLSLLALPALVQAQQEAPAAVQGQVLYAATGDAAAGVLLRFGSSHEVVSDREGRFVVEGLAPGVHEVVLVTPDCRLSGAEIEVAAGTLHHVELFLPATLEARAPAVETEQRRNPSALVVTAAEIEGMRVRNVSEVVRRVAPSMVGTPNHQVGGYARLQGRTINSLLDRQPPVVVVDGVRVSDAAEVLGSLQPSEVDRLEILRGSAGGWAYGSSGAAGAILVTTRRGAADAAPRAAEGGSRLDPRRCAVPGGLQGSDR